VNRRVLPGRQPDSEPRAHSVQLSQLHLQTQKRPKPVGQVVLQLPPGDQRQSRQGHHGRGGLLEHPSNERQGTARPVPKVQPDPSRLSQLLQPVPPLRPAPNAGMRRPQAGTLGPRKIQTIGSPPATGNELAAPRTRAVQKVVCTLATADQAERQWDDWSRTS
jgi:hypothetical protein